MVKNSSWYSEPERLAALEAAARSWVGTPFMANSAIPGPGGGVSCHNLVAELHFATGCLPRFPVPRGDPSALQHADPNHLLSILDSLLLPRGWSAAELPPIGCSMLDVGCSTFPPGSLAVLRYGRTLHHLATLLPGARVIHVIRLSGVLIEPLASLTSDPRVTLAACLIPPATS